MPDTLIARGRQPARATRPRWIDVLWESVAKQMSAAAFGLAMLAMILTSAAWWPEAWTQGAGLARYDALFLGALAVQLGMLALRLETLHEARAILLFHVVGTAMELFKTAAGSWSYPEPALFRLAGVPLFSGFMYAAVASYLARASRLFAVRLEGYPPRWAAAALAAAIYVNFFTHHVAPDLRWALFAAAALLFGRAKAVAHIACVRVGVPLLAAFVLVGLALWVAENLGTFGRAWAYPDQLAGWRPVSPHKMGSWTLLMIISFVMTVIAAEIPVNERGDDPRLHKRPAPL